MDPEKANYHFCDDLGASPLPPNTRVLVMGANGYVARRLIPELVHRGYFVRCMLRNKKYPPLLTHSRIEFVYVDCLKKEELLWALKDMEIAYYLIHSMRAKKNRFAEMDKMAARNFTEAAEASGLKKIIYLGGLGEISEGLSPHLLSRREVGTILSQGRVPVITLRAAIIIGSGSASHELLKSLILHNRQIPFLGTFDSLCQPIAIRDVIKYLVGIMETGGLDTREFHIGGREVLTYKKLISRFAKILKKEIRFRNVSWIPLPVEALCRLYAYWLQIFIPVPVNIISLLLDSLRTQVVCANEEIKKIIPFEPLGFDEAVERALDRENSARVFSHWSDATPDEMSHLMPLCEFESSEFFIEEHSINIPADADLLFSMITEIGGKTGWFRGNILWRLRGFADRLMGGVGLQRGRRDPRELRVGDAVDFWRVEKLEPGRELLLRAEFVSPGFSWLQFLLAPLPENGTRLTLRAHFIPHPFWGWVYWVLMSRFHTYIFKGMLESFRQKALGKNV